jgi:hypothetical protein
MGCNHSTSATSAQEQPQLKAVVAPGPAPEASATLSNKLKRIVLVAPGPAIKASATLSNKLAVGAGCYWGTETYVRAGSYWGTEKYVRQGESIR